MQMMKCPVCGAANSVKRTACFQCEGDLHAPPKPAAPDARVCKTCAHGSVHAPPGSSIAAAEVWCLKAKEAKHADNPAQDCFETSFAWNREESLD